MSTDDIRIWLVARLAEALQVAPEEVDVNAPFADHGLDSVAALQLTGALEETLARPLSPTVMVEHPTIEALARHLGS